MTLFRRRPAPARSAPEAIDAAEAALAGDEPDTALRHADHAVAAARRDRDPSSLAEALLVRVAALNELGRFADAERAATEACRADPDDPDAWLERAHAAYRLARFEAAAESALRSAELDEENADAWHLLGRARTWLGDLPAADADLARASALEPEDYVRPVRIAAAEFDRIAAEVWRAIPARFRARMGNTLVVAEELPDESDVADGFDPDTLGVYEGATALHDGMPERIVLFQRNHEAVCATLGALEDEVRRTLLHEVGHHFGMDEHELPY
ncbi:MAG TPA: metallopeptidase family protein [Candidatus Dormibacteraeota bacterium]|nr:metallopeptidase family protein [Candidatus Dormibacteraeota bacterium]